MSLVTFKIPHLVGKGAKQHVAFEEFQGDIAFFEVGGRKIKFVFQHAKSREGGYLATDIITPHLVHYDSGMIVCRGNTLAAFKVARYVASGNAGMTTREAAAQWLAEIVAEIGAEKFLAKIDAADKINA